MKVDPARWVHVFALSPHAKGLAQDMFQALWSCVTCVVVTVLVTLVTTPRPEQELRGLVYSRLPTCRAKSTGACLQRPLFWGMVALVILVLLQIIFW